MEKREYVFDGNNVKRLGAKKAFAFGLLAGFWMVLIGLGLSFTIILAIIGIPLIICGVLAPILAPFMYKNAYRLRCGACNQWIILQKGNKYTKVCRKCKTINKVSSVIA